MSEDLLARISELTRQIETLTAERSALAQVWAESACPYKVGDVVECKGYSYRGKKCQIASIGYRIGRLSLRWQVKAVVLKADGTPSSRVVDWTESQDEGLPRFSGPIRLD